MAALEELEILKQEGVHPGAFIWVHAQLESNGQLHLKAAQQGAWVEFDGISEGSAEKHLQLVKGRVQLKVRVSSESLSARGPFEPRLTSVPKDLTPSIPSRRHFVTGKQKTDSHF